MCTILKSHFPMLWDREELMEKIRSDPKMSRVFDSWKKEYQEEFLDFCTGVRGIKLLYDGFFKEIMSAEYTPERLNKFLSLLLGKKVIVKAVLPNDSTRIADESSLLITDIVVELEDGSFANVEVQKIGYNFPGQRSACYSSDMLLRQYKRVRAKKDQKFSYRDIQDVYTIVLYEKSPAPFHSFPDIYLHYFSQRSNTGLELDFLQLLCRRHYSARVFEENPEFCKQKFICEANFAWIFARYWNEVNSNLLQKFLFIPLDIFLRNQHNKDKVIDNLLDAWLLFFSSDAPEDILNIIEKYPKFQAMYEQAYQICRNVGDVMGIFSEELRMLDRNTVQLMIDDMQKTIDTQGEALREKDAIIAKLQETLKKLESQQGQVP